MRVIEKIKRIPFIGVVIDMAIFNEEGKKNWDLNEPDQAQLAKSEAEMERKYGNDTGKAGKRNLNKFKVEVEKSELNKVQQKIKQQENSKKGTERE